MSVSRRHGECRPDSAALSSYTTLRFAGLDLESAIPRCGCFQETLGPINASLGAEMSSPRLRFGKLDHIVSWQPRSAITSPGCPRGKAAFRAHRYRDKLARPCCRPHAPKPLRRSHAENASRCQSNPRKADRIDIHPPKRHVHGHDR
jgi:hypothetical protein